MRLVINTTDGASLKIEDFPVSGAMDIIDTWDAHPVLTIALDDGMAYFPKTSITRIDTHNTD
jgi:hypothetical protein